MRRHLQTLSVATALVMTLAASPALANQGQDRGDTRQDYGAPAYGASFRVDPAVAARCGLGAGSVRPAYSDGSYDDYDDRYGDRRDSGLGGALVGGASGGLAGNRIAGRGDRVIGTVAGAAVGAIAGRAIDRAGDRTGNRANEARDDRSGRWGNGGAEYASDECDAVLPPGYRLVSVPGEQECRDEVTTTEEWVP